LHMPCPLSFALPLQPFPATHSAYHSIVILISVFSPFPTTHRISSTPTLRHCVTFLPLPHSAAPVVNSLCTRLFPLPASHQSFLYTLPSVTYVRLVIFVAVADLYRDFSLDPVHITCPRITRPLLPPLSLSVFPPISSLHRDIFFRFRPTFLDSYPMPAILYSYFQTAECIFPPTLSINKRVSLFLFLNLPFSPCSLPLLIRTRQHPFFLITSFYSLLFFSPFDLALPFRRHFSTLAGPLPS